MKNDNPLISSCQFAICSCYFKLLLGQTHQKFDKIWNAHVEHY